MEIVGRLLAAMGVAEMEFRETIRVASSKEQEMLLEPIVHRMSSLFAVMLGGR